MLLLKARCVAFALLRIQTTSHPFHIASSDILGDIDDHIFFLLTGMQLKRGFETATALKGRKSFGIGLFLE